jgi:hypothetical protein
VNIPAEMKTATEWGSHLPALLACIAVTDGPVLELGVGHFSTPHLHAICGAMGRVLISVESNNEWYHEMESRYETDMHGFFIGTPQGLEAFGKRWGVAFIDHSPGGENRANAFRQLIEISDYVVMHDAQKDAENFKAVEPMLEGLNWYLCTGYFPHTLVASKTRQIPEVLKGM